MFLSHIIEKLGKDWSVISFGTFDGFHRAIVHSPRHPALGKTAPAVLTVA